MTLLPTLAPDDRAVLTAALTPGERIRWAARPRPSGMLGSFGIYVFAIPWTAFSLFWESMALLPFFASDETTPAVMKYGFGIVFPLFGIPFVLIGFGMLAAPFWAMARAGRTIHAVTDRRLVTIVRGKSTEVKSAFLDRIGPVERKSRADGRGTIRVQTHSRVDSDGDRITEKIEWIGIPDAVGVERLILEAQAPPR